MSVGNRGSVATSAFLPSCIVIECAGQVEWCFEKAGGKADLRGRALHCRRLAIHLAVVQLRRRPWRWRGRPDEGDTPDGDDNEDEATVSDVVCWYRRNVRDCNTSTHRSANYRRKSFARPLASSNFLHNRFSLFCLAVLLGLCVSCMFSPGCSLFGCDWLEKLVREMTREWRKRPRVRIRARGEHFQHLLLSAMSRKIVTCH